jgi:hypothetical protein
MSDDRRRIINYILSFFVLGAIFIISGYYSDLGALILISGIFPVVFIPIMLLFAFKKNYITGKGGLYLLAIIFSVVFYTSIVSLKNPEILKSSNINTSYILIIILSALISMFIHTSSYILIRFFGIQTNLKINETIKTISFPIINNNLELTKNTIEFFLEEMVSFEYEEKIDDNTFRFQRNENEYILIKYSTIPKQSNLLISFIMFHNDQDGVDSFKSENIYSFSIILGKLLGGDIIETPNEIVEYFNSYFLRYTPIINRISEYFGKSKINLSDIKNPLIYSVSFILIIYAVFNYEKIAQYIFSIDSDKLIKLMAILVGIPASIFYTLKIFGIVK